MADSGEKTLSELFSDGWKKFRIISDSDEPTNSQKLQTLICECQKILIRCTLMVNQLALFSKNEDISEVSTENIKFLLLPVFLGELSLKSTSVDRQIAVANTQVYVKDFLKRCFEYKFTTKDFSTEVTETRSMVREEKIQRFKQTKEINNKIDALDKRLSTTPEAVDEDAMTKGVTGSVFSAIMLFEVQRSYYIDWLQLWVNKSIENLDMLKSEIEILEHMEKLRLGKVKPQPPAKERKPMKPILITRDMIKKQVFGAGYRNLPTMTDEEYFQKELAEGKIVQEYQKGNEEKEKHSSDEDENIDDEQKLQKQRDWDDWKDTHRRGDGNKERHG